MVTMVTVVVVVVPVMIMYCWLMWPSLTAQTLFFCLFVFLSAVCEDLTVLLLLLWHCPAEPWGSPRHSIYGYTLTNAFHKVRGLCVCVTVLYCCSTWAATYHLQSIYFHCWRGEAVMQGVYHGSHTGLDRLHGLGILGFILCIGYPALAVFLLHRIWQAGLGTLHCLTPGIGQDAWVGYPALAISAPAQDLTDWVGYPTLSHAQDLTGCMRWVPCTSYLLLHRI